jgi:hypothetical protein
MVTGSPPSTALISAGSLFLASATLTFMNYSMAIDHGYVKTDGQTASWTYGFVWTMWTSAQNQQMQFGRIAMHFLQLEDAVLRSRL